jgi:hypothetical protein
MQLIDTQSGAETKAPVSGATRKMGGAILAAALTLPGVMPSVAQAEGAPENGLIGLRYLYYRDYQPNLDRIKVSAPSLYFLIPFGGSWSLSGSGVSDAVSGASPRWHSSVSSASNMRDLRNAGDLRITRYESRSSYSLSVSGSKEHDYLSRAASALANFSTEDNNRTWSVGVGRAWDKINPVNEIVTDATRYTTDMMVGVTQVLTPTDIAQVNLTHARARGYMNDPYKIVDQRPSERNQTALQLRWNHFFTQSGHTLRLGYRYYSDSYAVKAHTATTEYIMPVSNGWTFTPLARYHQQSAASFYYDPVYDPVLGAPYPPSYLSNPTALMSPDQRLSAFGAGTIGARVAKQLDATWTWDMRVEFYQQRGSWRLFGTGSPGIEPFSAWIIQTGVTKTF